MPIEAEGFEYKGDGGLPRPTIRIANLNSNITQLLLGVNAVTPGNDLNGAQVTRIRTLSRFLDGINWENGINPYGNPSTDEAAQMPKEVYYIDRKVTETRDLVEFEMVSSLDLAMQEHQGGLSCKTFASGNIRAKSAVIQEQRTLRQSVRQLLHQPQLITLLLLAQTFCQLETALTVERL